MKIIMTDRAKTDKVSEFKISSIVSIKNCDKSRSSIGIEVSETKKYRYRVSIYRCIERYYRYSIVLPGYNVSVKYHL